MTPQDLIAAFTTLADAPDGTKRLRELVLQLAVRGKLVAQDASDEPASVLLTRIAAEKARLVAEKKIRKPKALPPIEAAEVPFEVPEGWALIRFGDAFNVIMTGPFGTALKKSEYVPDGTPVINPQNLKDRRIIPTPSTSIGPDTLQRLSTFKVELNDVVVARRGEMGRCAVVGPAESGWLCGTGSLVLRPACGIYPLFVALFLRSPHTVSTLGGESVGATMKNLNQRIMTRLQFGLPPLAEQHRIVAKVDALMGLLDRLEAAREARDGTRTSLRDSALSALADAEDAASARTAWTRMSGQMDELFTDPSDVAPLRQTILQLAVRGRLVAQDASDEPAGVLLERIAAEKDKKKPSRHDRPIECETAPFMAPRGWVWVFLGGVSQVERGGSPRPIKDFLTDDPDGLNWIKIGDTEQGGKYITSTKQRIRPEGLKKTRMVYPGDFLLTNSMSFGRPYITQIEGCIHDGWLRIKPPEGVDKNYLYLVLSSPYLVSQFKQAAAGAVVMNLNADKVRHVPIPIPPLAEQHRIVAKVDALMALCDDLEARLTAAKTTRGAFAAAAVHHLDAA